MTENKLILFCGPSGSGKTSIVQHLLKEFSQLSFSVSATTRNKRNGEVHGKDYYFMTVNEFHERIRNDEFLEWEEVYESGYYGTLRSEIDRIGKMGKGSHLRCGCGKAESISKDVMGITCSMYLCVRLHSKI